MFPIRGLIVKKNYRSCWIVYDRKSTSSNGKADDSDEDYEIIAALPPHPTPDASIISRIFVG